jgi:hypothetical protein
VLAGACLDIGTEGLPFAPFSAMLRELVRDMSADGVAGLLPGQATREVAWLTVRPDGAFYVSTRGFGFGPGDGRILRVQP